MPLKEAYQYIFDNNLAITDTLDFSMTLARIKENLDYMPQNISLSLDELIDEVEEDIADYGENEVAWIYFHNYDDTLIPDDYLLKNYDKLLYNLPYLEIKLKDVLEIFKRMNSIL